MLHGFPLDSRIWKHQLETLGETWRVIAPDFRGFGRSRATDPFSIQSLADDVGALIAKLSLSRPVLGGLSMGGYVTLAYARHHAAELRGIFLADTRAEADAPATRLTRDQMIQQVRAQGARPVAQGMLEKLLAPQTRQMQPKLVHDLLQIMEGCDPLTIEHALEALRDRPDQVAALGAIHLPALIVVGQDDVLTPPALAQTMHAAIADSQLVIVPDAGHMAPMEQPEAVNAALESFMKKLA